MATDDAKTDEHPIFPLDELNAENPFAISSASVDHYQRANLYSHLSGGFAAATTLAGLATIIAQMGGIRQLLTNAGQNPDFDRYVISVFGSLTASSAYFAVRLGLSAIKHYTIASELNTSASFNQGIDAIVREIASYSPEIPP